MCSTGAASATCSMHCMVERPSTDYVLHCTLLSMSSRHECYLWKLASECEHILEILGVPAVRERALNLAAAAGEERICAA